MSVYIERHGNVSRPSLVLLHGWGMSSQIWDSILSSLTPYFYVTTIDLPGLGRSVADTTPSLQSIAFEVAKQVERPSIWLGWSLGGVVATQIAVDHPEKVRGLVTVASNPCFVSREDWPCAMPAETYQQFKSAVNVNPIKALSRFSMLQVQGGHNAKPLLKCLKDIVEQSSPSHLMATLEILEGDYRALWAQVQKPALHLLGSVDALVPESLADGLEEIVPDHDVVMFNAAGHLPFLAFPQAFVESLAIFARGLARDE